MHTLAKRNNWKTLSKREIRKSLPLMKATHRYRMSVAVALLLLFGIHAPVMLIINLINGTFNEFLKIAWIYLLAIPFIFIAVYSIVDCNRKMRSFKEGRFQVANVNIYSKGIGSGQRTKYNSLTVSGLYKDNKPVRKDFRVTKQLYNALKVGDRAYVVKYDYKKTKDPLAELDLIPIPEP